MKIVCTGGRDYDDAAKVDEVLSEYSEAEIIVGCANGLDRLVREWCGYGLMNPNVEVANWLLLGKMAGNARNTRMLEREPDLVIVFPGGRGTMNCMRQARDRGIPIREIER